jgi:L-lysine exporter family protein LysE/ArgO
MSIFSWTESGTGRHTAPMDTWNGLAAGFTLMGGLIVAIGAQNAFVLRQGLRREHVGAAVAFCIVADVLLVGAGVAGVGGVLARWPSLARALALGGAAFLAMYAWQAFGRVRHPQALARPGEAPATNTRRAVLAQAAAFTLLNPHVYLDTLLLAGTVGARHAPGLQPWFVLGAGSASALWFTGLGLGAHAAAPWLARPAVWRGIDAVVGLTMAVMAALLLHWAWVGTLPA